MISGTHSQLLCVRTWTHQQADSRLIYSINQPLRLEQGLAYYQSWPLSLVSMNAQQMLEGPNLWDFTKGLRCVNVL